MLGCQKGKALVSDLLGAVFANGAATATFQFIVGGLSAAAEAGELTSGGFRDHGLLGLISFGQVPGNQYGNGVVTMEEWGPGGYFESTPTVAPTGFVVPTHWAMTNPSVGNSYYAGARVHDGASSQATRVLAVEMTIATGFAAVTSQAARHLLVHYHEHIRETLGAFNNYYRSARLRDILEGMDDAALPRINPNDYIPTRTPPAYVRPYNQ